MKIEELYDYFYLFLLKIKYQELYHLLIHETKNSLRSLSQNIQAISLNIFLFLKTLSFLRNRALKWLSELLVRTDKKTFSYYLYLYWKKYEDFLKEKRLNSKWKLEYIHKKTRSAYFSLKNNLKFLFTRYLLLLNNRYSKY